MWGVMRRPSWIAFTVLVLVLCVAFVELGRWQWRRHDERAALNDRVAASLTQDPVPVGDLLDVDTAAPEGILWRQVTAVGRYDSGNELLVRNRSYEGSTGFEIVTPLVTTSGTALLVDRGWMPAGDTATDQPVAPPAPAGEVTVTARVQQSSAEGAGAEGLPAGQIRRVSVPEIAAGLPYPVYGAPAALLPGQPGAGTGDAPPRVVQPPEPSGGPHLAYAVQWWLFIPISIGGWVLLLRSEARTAADATRRGGLVGVDPPRVST